MTTKEAAANVIAAWDSLITEIANTLKIDRFCCVLAGMLKRGGGSK